VIGTDGFLLTNAELAARGLLPRKGFPESYDRALVTDVLGRVALGAADVEVPHYSHRLYDITGERVSLGRPDVLIVEGVNALDPSIADYASLLVYLDAEEDQLRRWFATRFAALVADAEGDQDSFFSGWVGMDGEQIEGLALAVWEHVNGVNLREHILPTRWRADIVLRKGPGHAATDVAVRLR
jgi:type I pantothenate kinase